MSSCRSFNDNKQQRTFIYLLQRWVSFQGCGVLFYASFARNVGCSCNLPFQCVQATFPAKLTTAVPAWLGGFPAPLPRRTCGPSELAKEKQGKYSEVGVFVCLVRCNGRKESHEFPVFHFLLLLCITYICFPDQPL